MEFTNLRYDSTVGNGSFLYYLLNLQTQYDPNVLGRNNVFRYWVNDDAPYDIVVINSDNLKLTRSVMESITEFNNSTILIKVENCEQLIAVSQCIFNNNYINDDIPSGKCDIIIEIQNDLYFQNDSIYKNAVPNSFCYEIYKIILGKLFVHIQPKAGEVKIQGIQITDNNFFRVYEQGSSPTPGKFVFVNNIYFKDCVFTKIARDSSSNLPIYALCKENLIFDSCKMSIHIRASEYGYAFDFTKDVNGNGGGEAQWENCSLYIEYSDVDEDKCPYLPGYSGKAGYFNGNKDNCSIIVRNLALRLVQYISSIVTQLNAQGSSNCSWDIECYYLFIDNVSEDAPTSYPEDIFAFNGYYKHILNISCLNSFVSFKVKKLRYKGPWPNTSSGEIVDITYTGDQTFDKPIVSFGGNSNQTTAYSTGVNVFNTGDGHGIQFQAANHSNVKQLSESDCKNPTVLNKWGFFVNHDYTYTPLATEPEDWTNTYWLYYYYDESIQTYKNIPKGMAPTFVANQYYQKVDD